MALVQIKLEALFYLAVTVGAPVYTGWADGIIIVLRIGSYSLADKQTKHRQIFEELRRAIITREYQPGQKLPTDSQLGEHFNTSRLTIMRALRDLQSEGLVKRKAGSGTYISSEAEATPHVFGLIIPDLGEGEIFEPVCQGMARTGQSEHQALLWGNTSPGADTKAKQAEELCRYYIAKNVAGVFFAPIELIEERMEVNQRIVSMLEAADIPIVLLDRDIYEYPRRSRFDVVGLNNHRAGHLMAAHLLQTGIKRVGFIARVGSAPTVKARIAGYREALWEAGVQPEQSWIAWGDPSDTNFVRKYVETVRPEGVLCATDYTAGLFMQSLSALKIDVPKKVRIVGFDDVKYASLLPVPLTTLRQPCYAIGATAIYTMLCRISKPELLGRDILLDGELIVRQSCGVRGAKDRKDSRREAKPVVA